MDIADRIRRFLEDSAFVRSLDEKSTWQIFLLFLTALVGLGAAVGKIFDWDKSLAEILSRATQVNATTKTPELETWFLPFVLLGMILVASLILMIAWSIKRYFATTKDQAALEEIMSAVRRIRDQAKQPKIKAWDSLKFVYLVNKDFSGSLKRVSVMKSIDAPVHFWESINTVEDDAQPAASLAEVNYRVQDLSGGSSNIVYLPSENAKRIKKACLFFLPPIQPGEKRMFEISFEWPGLFKRLKKSGEDFEFKSLTRDVLSLYQLEIYLQEGSGYRLECEITGDQYTQQKLEPIPNYASANGWRGHGYIYEVRDVPAGPLRFVLQAKVKR